MWLVTTDGIRVLCTPKEVPVVWRAGASFAAAALEATWNRRPGAGSLRTAPPSGDVDGKTAGKTPFTRTPQLCGGWVLRERGREGGRSRIGSQLGRAGAPATHSRAGCSDLDSLRVATPKVILSTHTHTHTLRAVESARVKGTNELSRIQADGEACFSYTTAQARFSSCDHS